MFRIGEFFSSCSNPNPQYFVQPLGRASSDALVVNLWRSWSWLTTWLSPRFGYRLSPNVTLRSLCRDQARWGGIYNQSNANEVAPYSANSGLQQTQRQFGAAIGLTQYAGTGLLHDSSPNHARRLTRHVGIPDPW